MEADVVSGPLAFVAQGYREELHRIGYKRLSEQRQMTLLTHLNEWMAAREIAAEGITPLVVASVRAERQRAGWRLHTEVGARPLLNYLRRQGLHSQRVEVPSGPLAQLLTRYHDYLTRERGLRPGTIVRYEKGARLGNTRAMLRECGFEADRSVVPRWNFACHGGPAFPQLTASPFWIDHERHLLELHVSARILIGEGAHAALDPIVGHTIE